MNFKGGCYIKYGIQGEEVNTAINKVGTYEYEHHLVEGGGIDDTWLAGHDLMHSGISSFFIFFNLFVFFYIYFIFVDER